jgi:hypothetical protein
VIPAFCQSVALSMQNSNTRSGTVRPSAIMSAGRPAARDADERGEPKGLPWKSATPPQPHKKGPVPARSGRRGPSMHRAASRRRLSMRPRERQSRALSKLRSSTAAHAPESMAARRS